MSKFSDSSHYILSTYFNQLLDPRTGTHNSFLSGQRKTIWADGGLNTTLYQKNDSGDFVAHRFLIQSISEDNFIFSYIDRVSDHSEATELEVDREMYFRKDSLFHDWLRVNATTYEQSINTNKTFIYFGKIYTLTGELSRYNIIFDGMKNYVVYGIPEHNRTEKLIELLGIFFDEVYQDIYNMTKTLWSFFDAREVDLDHLNYMATRANIETDIDKIETELLLREFVDTLPWWLKRKGSYSSYLDIYKLLLGNTKNKLNFYERWIEWCLKTVRAGADTIPDSDFEDHHYLEFYGQEPTGGAGPFYYDQYASAGYPEYADTAPAVSGCGEVRKVCKGLTAFTGWGAQDSGDNMSVVGYNIQIDGFNPAGDSVYLYTTTTSAANIRNCIEVSMDSSSVPSGGLFVWAASNYPDKTLDAHELNNRNYIGISYEILGATPSGAITGRRFKLWENYNGTLYANESIGTYNADTEYYLAIQKIGTNFSVSVFDNPLRRDQDFIETITLSLHENASYSVRYTVNHRTITISSPTTAGYYPPPSGGASWTGDIQNYYTWFNAVDSVAVTGYKVLSPHYRLEIDLSSEPMGEDFIISQNQADELLRYWEYLKPVSKFIHYNWLISPLGQIDTLSTSVPLYSQSDYTAFLNTQFIGQNFVSAAAPSAAGDFYEETYRETIVAADSLWIVRHGLATDELIIQTYTAGGFQNWAIRHYYPDDNRVEIEFAGSENGRILAAGLKPLNYSHTQSTPLTAWTVYHNQATSMATSGIVFECVSTSGSAPVDYTLSTELDTHFNIGTESLAEWTSYMGPTYWATSGAHPSAAWQWNGSYYTKSIPLTAGQVIENVLTPVGTWVNDFVREKVRLTYTVSGGQIQDGTQWWLYGTLTPNPSAIAISTNPAASADTAGISTVPYGDWWYDLGDITRLEWDLYTGDPVYSFLAVSAGAYFDALISTNYFVTNPDNAVDGDTGTNATLTGTAGTDGQVTMSLYTSGNAVGSATVSGDYLDLLSGIKYDTGLNFETGGGFLTTRAASGNYVRKDDDTRLVWDFGNNGIGDFEIWFDVFWEGALTGTEPRDAYNTNGGLSAPPYTGSEISYFFLTDYLGTVKSHGTLTEGLKWGTHRNAFNNILWHVHDFDQYPTGYNNNGAANVNYPYGVAKRTGADISIRFWDSPTRDGTAQTLTSVTSNQTDKKRYLYVFASWGNDTAEADWIRIGMKNVRLVSGDFVPSAASTLWFPDSNYDITKVEVKAFGSGTTSANAIPLFSGTTSGDSYLIPSAGLTEHQWFDITSDTNAPSPWTWQDVEDLFFKVKFVPGQFDGSFYVDVNDFEVNGKVNALTDFPMKVFLNNHSGKNNLDLTDVFTTIGNDYTKFRVVDDSGTTLWTEVEKWDANAANPSGSVWVRVPSFPTTGTKRFKIEYGQNVNNNRIDVTGTSKAAKVWDSDFVYVYHMNQIPTTGSNPSPLINSQIASGCNMPSFGGNAKPSDIDWRNHNTQATSGAGSILFDNASPYSGYRCYNGYNTLGMDAFTIESVISPSKTGYTGTTDDYIVNHVHSDDANVVLKMDRDYPTNQLRTYAWINGGGYGISSQGTIKQGRWYYMGGKWSNAGSQRLLLGENTTDNFVLTSGGSQYAGTFDRGSAIHYLGEYNDTSYRGWAGYIGEVRLSRVERPNSYIKATYETMFDNLINYGVPSGASGESFNVSKGDVRVTYNVPQGQTGWTGPSSYQLRNIEFYNEPVSATKIEIDGLPREAAGYVLLDDRGDLPNYEYDFEFAITSAGRGDSQTVSAGGGSAPSAASTYYVVATDNGTPDQWVTYNQALFPFGEQTGGDASNYYGVWMDNKFAYFGCNFAVGLQTWRHDGAGGLTKKDEDVGDGGGNIGDVWVDETVPFASGRWVFTANGNAGLKAWTVDNSGTITWKDTDDDGGNIADLRGVYGDGNYIYAADNGSGLHSYTFDGTSLTHVDSDEQILAGGSNTYYKVWCGQGDHDGYIFAATEDGLLAYSQSGGVLSYINVFQAHLQDVEAVYGDDDFIYIVSGNTQAGSGVYSLTFNGSAFTSAGYYPADNFGFSDVWARPEGGRVYFTMSFDGIAYANVDDNGVLTPGTDYDPGSYAFRDIHGYQKYDAGGGGGTTTIYPRGGEVALIGASNKIGNLDYFTDTPSANAYALRAVTVSANTNLMLTNYWGLSGGDAYHANDNNRVWTIGDTAYGDSTSINHLYGRFIKYSSYSGQPAVAAEFYSDSNRTALLRRMIVNNANVPSDSPNYVYGTIAPGDTVWPEGKITGYVSNMLGLGRDEPEIMMPKRAVSMPNKLYLEWSKPVGGKCYIRDEDYYHEQSTAASTWVINHNLNIYGAIIMCYDDSRQLIFPDQIELVDADTTHVHFNSAVAGSAVFVIFQRDYETDSFLAPFSNPDIIGFWKVGNGGDEVGFEPVNVNDINSPLVSGSLLSFSETASGNQGYVLLSFKVPESGAYTFNEFGVFDENKNLHYYSKLSDLHKPDGVALDVLYRISKTPLVV
jgi:hypothetical protein